MNARLSSRYAAYDGFTADEFTLMQHAALR